MSSRAALWGAGAVLGYLAAALLTVWAGLLPLRPLYDGLAPPQPYNWIDPPEGIEDNVVPETETFTIELREDGSAPGSVTTADGQASLILPGTAIAPMEGEEEVRVDIVPLAPDEVSPPPEGLTFDGNAYRFSATYAATGEPVVIERELMVVLRYPAHAEVMLRYDEGGGWRELEADVAPASLQLFADTGALGVFVAAAPPDTGTVSEWIPYVAVALGVAAAIIIFVAKRRERSSGPPEAGD